MLTPMSFSWMRREIRLFAAWYNTERPHTALAGRTPQEVWSDRTRRRRRLEPRTKWPHRQRRRSRGDKFTLATGKHRHFAFFKSVAGHSRSDI
jgi:hypothetical protein